MKNTLSLLLAVLLACPSFAGPYDPPANYYSTATGTGATLKSQLHNIIDDHTFFFYSEARSILQVTDRDPNDPSNIILVYDRQSLDVSGLSASGIPGWDSGISWNREHVWPRSRGINDDAGDDNSDLHNLRPGDPQVNSDRANYNLGGAFGQQAFGLVTDSGATYWYPGNADAGMVARQSFYMAVRYDASDSLTTNLELANGNPASFGTTMGNLSRLIEWHYAAVPDDFELRRNDVIYDSYQGNRNPFIDRPEYVWSVFVDQANDSRVTINGGTATADPSQTSKTINFGSVLVGAATGSLSQAVTIDKAGTDGTYYQISVSGDATSSKTGRYNAFNTNATDSETITVGLAATTASAGLKTGSVTIDNLDITTAGGAGRGANDANDTITTQLNVLDHSNASFNPSTDQNTLTIDFGQVTQGSTPAPISFNLYNLQSTAGFTADLVMGLTTFTAGDFFLNVSGLTGTVAPGQSTQGQAQFFTPTLGSFASTWTINARDPLLPGATAQQLIVQLTGEVIAALLLGDFNNDSLISPADYNLLLSNLGGAADPYDLNDDAVVDLADLQTWVTTIALTSFGDLDFDRDVDDADFGLAFASFTGPGSGGNALPWENGDIDLDGDVDDADFGLAFANFTGPGSSSNVPEPTTGLVMLVLIYSCTRSKRKKEQ